MKRYTAREIEVTYDPVRCLHAAECVRGLPSVFDTARRPWVQADGADPEALASVIGRCPRLALRARAVWTPTLRAIRKPTLAAVTGADGLG